MKFEEVLEKWWALHKLSIRDITASNEVGRISAHILPYFGEMKIDEVDEFTICDFINFEKTHGNHTTGKGLCQNSVIAEVKIVRYVLGYAKIKGYVQINPADLIPKMHREPAKEFKIFTRAEIETIVKAARPKWLGDLILLAYLTGMRKCECYGLQWSDIDFTQKYLKVCRSVTAARPNDRFITVPKTKASNRIIRLDDRALSMLSAKIKKRTSDIWVAANQYGELISPWYNVRYFRDTCTRAGVPIKRFHDLRHTHITELVRAGIPLPVVQKRAGHANLDTTMHYAHIDASDQECITRILNDRR